MKRIFFIAASMMLCGGAAACNIQNQGTATVVVSNYDWESCGTVTSLKTGNVSISRLKCPLEYNSSTGQYRINYRTTWYSVKTSDKSEYMYMFYYNNKPHYFNF